MRRLHWTPMESIRDSLLAQGVCQCLVNGPRQSEHNFCTRPNLKSCRRRRLGQTKVERRCRRRRRRPIRLLQNKQVDPVFLLPLLLLGLFFFRLQIVTGERLGRQLGR